MSGVSLPPTTQVMNTEMSFQSLGAAIPAHAALADLDSVMGYLDAEDLTSFGLESDTFKGTPVPNTRAVTHSGAPARQVSSRNRGLRRKRSFGDIGGGSSLAPRIPFAPFAPLVHATAPGSTDMPAASNPASYAVAMAGIADLDFFSGDDPMDEITGADGAVLPEQCTPAFGGPTREVSYLLEHWDEFWLELMCALEAAEYNNLAKMLLSPPEAAEEEEMLSPHRRFLEMVERIRAAGTGTVPCVTLIATVLTDPELKVQLSPDIYEVGRPQGVGGEP